MALSKKDKAAVKKAAEAGGLKNVKVSSSGQVTASNSKSSSSSSSSSSSAPKPVAPIVIDSNLSAKDQAAVKAAYIAGGGSESNVSYSAPAAPAPTPVPVTGTPTTTTKGTMQIITDPLTGQKFARDTSVPGSTFQPYTGDANAVPPAQPVVPKTPIQPIQVPTVPEGDAAPQINTNLGPGSTGSEVVALQNYLLKLGYSIPSLKSGAAKPGNYGPETQAAVAQWQKDQEAAGKLKVPDVSQYGYFGPLSRQALQQGAGQSGVVEETPVVEDTLGVEDTATDLTATIDALRTAYGLPPIDSKKTPVEQAMEDYNQIYDSLGIPSIKQSYTEAVEEFTKWQNELNDKIAEIRDDPWLSQGIADGRVARLEAAYEGKIKIATSKMQLFDSLVKEGIAQAKDIMNQVNQIQADRERVVGEAIDIVQKRNDALNDLDTEIVEAGGRKLLINSKTGDTIKDLGAVVKSSSGGGSSSGTEAERKAAALGAYKEAFVPGARMADGTPVLDSNSYITPAAWRAAIDDYPGSRADFIKEYGYLLYMEKGKPSASYGLTPTEIKLITGEL